MWVTQAEGEKKCTSWECGGAGPADREEDSGRTSDSNNRRQQFQSHSGAQIIIIIIIELGGVSELKNWKSLFQRG